jgi:hypothetical protein
MLDGDGDVQAAATTWLKDTLSTVQSAIPGCGEYLACRDGQNAAKPGTGPGHVGRHRKTWTRAPAD